MKKCIRLIFTMLLATACTKGTDMNDSGESSTAGTGNSDSGTTAEIVNGPISLRFSHSTLTTATFTGKVAVPTEYMPDFEVGLIYYQNVEFASEDPSKLQITDAAFEVTLEDLLMDTEYCYTTYAVRNGITEYGKIQTFKTGGAALAVTLGKVTATTAKFSYEVLGEVGVYDSVETGILFSRQTDIKYGGSDVFKAEIPDPYIEPKGSVGTGGLRFDEQYYYRSYIRNNEQCIYGEELSFSTNKVEIELDEVESPIISESPSVTFTGRIKGELSDADKKIIWVRVFVKKENINNTIKTLYSDIKGEEVAPDGTLSVTIAGLSVNTIYEYWFLAIVGSNVCIESEIKRFTIYHPDNVPTDQD